MMVGFVSCLTITICKVEEREKKRCRVLTNCVSTGKANVNWYIKVRGYDISILADDVSFNLTFFPFN